MNKVMLMGRLTREPDIRYTQGEQMVVARFTLAVNRKYAQNGQQSADFIPCIAFGKNAEFFERYTHQGTKLVIEGHIQTGSYINKDGRKVYTTDVIIETSEFAESKENSDSNERIITDTDGFMKIPEEIDDDGVPFR